ncbi:MAG: ABC transporter permease [Spirochaetales bacterium]|nr:ABC transporter permease [Spirochaetales bacterium]
MKFHIPFVIGFKNFTGRGRFIGIPAQLRGAIIGIGLSLIPLIVVIVVTNGMIEGITQRLIEITTYHLQVTLYDFPSTEKMQEIARDLTSLKGVKHAFVEKSGFALFRFRDNLSGVTVRCVPESLYKEDEGFHKYFHLEEGGFILSSVPEYLKPDILERKMSLRISNDEQIYLADMYVIDRDRELYVLKDTVTETERKTIAGIFSKAHINTVLLGKALADKLKAGIGDQVFILAYNDFRSKIVLKSAKCIVSGIFTTGYQEIDKVLAYIPFQTGSLILPEEKSKEFIGIKVNDPFGNINEIRKRIKQYLIEKDNLFSDIETWYELQINQYRAFQTTKTILIFIMLLIIIVAAVNVYSSMLMLVMEKTHEIAILKSMGASPLLISSSFFIIGFYTGVLGCLIGITAGLTIAVNINELIKGVEYIFNLCITLFENFISPFYQIKSNGPFIIFNPEFYLEEIPVRISFFEIFSVACITVFIATLSAYLPSAEAGRIKPLEVIRKY